MTKTLTLAELKQFTGTEQWYRHQTMRKVLYTDGVQYLAEQAGAYWLVDEIAFAQAIDYVAAAEFQVWRMHVDASAAAELYCEDGNGNKIIEKRIAFTDFPLSEITLYLQDNVLMLPSEY